MRMKLISKEQLPWGQIQSCSGPCADESFVVTDSVKSGNDKPRGGDFNVVSAAVCGQDQAEAVDSRCQGQDYYHVP